MSALPADAELSPVKRALLQIRELRERLAEVQDGLREPIAIVGMALRVPGGVRNAEQFEQLLWSGTDAITPIPAERWSLDDWFDERQDAPGKMLTRFGGFIDEVDLFDAEFFGIAPVEAASMDPQQRLVLELAWEALEDAGHAPAALAGSRAGVYLGIANGDYGRALFTQPERIDPYFSPGNAFSVAAGRLSYVLGLHGPAIAIDTACSSSLVALHLACQGLRLGECDLALAGGVNLILTPELNINFSKAGMMARDGRCKTFDAAADGYVRGEGAGIVVLRRLRDALAGGDRILAVVRGSAVNQDGRSNGLTAPNGPAQSAVVRAALQAARVAPSEVGYIETHGTGTSLGDPIEVHALGAVFGEGRTQPLALGSVKTNIGHLEAAAGIAGVIKTVLALQRREIPPHLHFEQKNPHIDWDTLPFIVPTAAQRWPLEGAMVAGVSSFGFSGTNAHVVLGEAPAAPERRPAAQPRASHLFTLSARDAGALSELVQRHEAALAAAGAHATLGDLCFTANSGRSHFVHRLAVRASTLAELGAGLAAFRNDEPHPLVVSGVAGPQVPRVAFLFPGQGPQYAGMARELYDSAPAFRESFNRCAEQLDALLPSPIRDVVFAAAGSAAPLDDTAFAQPAMFAVEVALAALWRSWGIEPAAVLGHSFGEYAAACVAGAITLDDAARMVVARGRLVQRLPRDGAMAVLEASEQEVAALLARIGGRVAIAALNGPSNVVVSGERSSVEAVAAGVASSGARVKMLRVSHAFHSPLIEPVLPAFEAELAGVGFATPSVQIVSSLTGRAADLEQFGRPAYWRDHMRQPVRFAAAMQALAAQGITHYIEMSPHPVLLGMGAESVAHGEWLPSLREGADAWSVMLGSLQSLYAAGAAVDWTAFHHGQAHCRVALPTYPFRRKRHWIDTVAPPAAQGISAGQRWARLGAALDRQSQRGPLDLDVSSYPAKWDCLARLTDAHAVATLREAELFVRAGERHTTQQLLDSAGIAGTYRHLVQRWLQRLCAAGLLHADGDGFVAARALPEPDLDALWQEAEQRFADNRPLLAYVRHCGALVAEVLTGRESPLETLFPGGSFDLATGLYEQSATMRYINELAASAFDALGACTPEGRTLRVLEVGAGTGGTTGALLDVLPPERTRYRFTDLSDAFLDRARQRFAGRDFVEFAHFDLDGDDGEPQSFDAIVAANAVHACRDLPATLRRLARLLAPGAVLVLVESTRHLSYFDMTTGLIEGWQHFSDGLRDDNPLLGSQQWIDALLQAGFDAARAWPPAGSAAEVLGQHVIVARMPGDAAAVASPVAEQRSVAPAAAASVTVQVQLWRERLDEVSAAERIDVLRELVRTQVMQVLKLDPSAPPARHDRLMDLGLDSLMAVQLRNALGRALELERPLSSTLMFDHPTIDAVAAHLLEQLAPQTRSVPVAPPAARASAASVPLAEAAVAGMSDDEISQLLLERMGDA